jgi:hypothetical protein
MSDMTETGTAMKKTNSDHDLEQQRKSPSFESKFQKAGKALAINLRGTTKPKKSSTSLAKEWAEHKREERKLENRRSR